MNQKLLNAFVITNPVLSVLVHLGARLVFGWGEVRNQTGQGG